MNISLAQQYADYDNALNQYFDQVLLDLITDEFRQYYHKLRQDILNEILKDNDCSQPIGTDSPVYTRHADYDDIMMRLLEHYYTVKKNPDNILAIYEVELMMVEHYLTLCGFFKDELGYWYLEGN